MSDDVELRTVPPQAVAVVRGDVSPEDLPTFLGGAFEEVAATLAHQGLSPVGPPFGRYLPKPDGSFQVEAGFPVTLPVTAAGRVEPDQLPGGTVARIVYRGQYDGVGEAYVTAEEWIGEHGYRVSGQAWECYLDEPDAPYPRTAVCVPCSAESGTKVPG